MNLTRKQAVTALLAALPGAAMAADRPLSWGSAKALEYKPPRYVCIFKPDGSWEIPLDGWTCIRMTLGGESVEFTPAELFAALREEEHVHEWHRGPLLANAVNVIDPIRTETCACGALRRDPAIERARGEEE